MRAAVSLAPLFVPELEEMRGPIIADNLKKLGAIAYVMASESWMLALPPEAQQQGKMPELERPIREDDRRVSVVSLMGENRVGDYVTVSLKIAEGRKRKLDLENPMHIAYDSKAKDKYGGGRLMGLLDDEMTH